MRALISATMIKKFWEEEVIASNIYKFMAKKSKKRRKLFERLAFMENQHADFWDKVANRFFGKKFKKSFGLKLKIFFYKILSIFLPTSFMIYYLELGEKSATSEYSIILKEFKEIPEVYERIKRIIQDEIEHEIELADILIGEKSRISNIRDAIYGMTDSLVEILALVIGLAGITNNTLTIGLTGLIAAIGGTFSMTTGAYLSTKSQRDIYEGEISEIETKASIAPDLLIRDLEVLLIEKGLDERSVRRIIGEMEVDHEELKSIVRHLKIEEGPLSPISVAKVTGIYYILGALPPMLPFFVAYFFSVDPVFTAIISVFFASITAFFAGIFTAVLSGTKIKKKALMNVLVIIGAAMATYSIGSLARILLGIEI